MKKKVSRIPLAEGYETVIEYHRLRDLQSDRRYNRVLDDKWVSHLVRHYKAVLAGCLLVGRRSDGSLYLIDGQHRRLALLQKFGSWFEARCEVVISAGWEWERDLFIHLNTKGRRRLRRADLVHIALMNPKGDPLWNKIHDSLRARQFYLKLGAPTQVEQWQRRDWMGVDCFEAIEATAKLGYLDEWADFTSEAWRNLPESVFAETVRGVVAFIRQFPPSEFPMQRAVIAFLNLGPKEISARSENLAARFLPEERFSQIMREHFDGRWA